MSKNIIVNGKKMKLKHLEGIMVDGNKAMIVRYNCTAMYSKYAVVIQHMDGSLSEYYSDAEKSKRIKLYISYDEPNEVIFEVPDCNNNWTKIFIYLFDDDSVL